jgi:type II secretory pathway pseudopilin PulG
MTFNKKTYFSVILNSKGFTLLELLLVVGISASIGLLVLSLLDDFTKRSVNRDVAGHLLRVHAAAEEYVLSNFTSIITSDIPTVGDVATINVVTDIAASGFLTAGFNPVNKFRQNVTVVVRNVGVSSGGDTIEVLSVSEDRGVTSDAMTNERLLDAALSGGSKLGFTDHASNTINSAYGEWSLNVPSFSAILNYRGTATTGYIAAYGRVSLDSTFNDQFLYRVSITGRPELNQMQTDIEMEQNALIGAGVILADQMAIGYDNYAPENANPWAGANTATGNIALNAEGTGSGNFAPFAMGIDQALNVAGTVDVGFRISDGTVGANCSIDAAGNVVAVAGFTPATDCIITGGNLNLREVAGAVITNPELSVTSLDISGNTSGTPSAVGLPTAINVNIAEMGEIQGSGAGYNGMFNDVTVNGEANAGELNAFGLEAGSATSLIANFDAEQIQTGSANFNGSNLQGADSAVVGVLNLQAGANIQSGDFGIAGNMDVNRGLTSDRMTARQQLFFQNVTGCDITNGCPGF